MPAPRTGAAGIPGIDRDDRHASKSRLVFDTRAEMGETPIAERPAEAARGNRFKASADVFEIFKNDPRLSCLGLLHQTFADNVICMFLKASLPLAHAFQVSFGVLGSFPLVLLAGRVPPPTVALDLLSGERLAIAVRGEVDDAEIDADPVFRLQDRRLFEVHGDVEEELAVAENEIGLSHLAGEHPGEVVGDDEGHFDAASRGVDASL